MLMTLQKVIALYANAQSKDKTIRHPAHQKLKQIQEILLNT
jgi:hypothetical protein